MAQSLVCDLDEVGHKTLNMFISPRRLQYRLIRRQSQQMIQDRRRTRNAKRNKPQRKLR